MAHRREHAKHEAHPKQEGPKDELRLVRLPMGGVYASKTEVKITTLLGSCVAACLYDPAAQVGGMNHILLPGGG
ncbi:MAG: chemotaxis protein CheD [Terriglobales bacterium]